MNSVVLAAEHQIHQFDARQAADRTYGIFRDTVYSAQLSFGSWKNQVVFKFRLHEATLLVDTSCRLVLSELHKRYVDIRMTKTTELRPRSMDGRRCLCK